MTDQVKVLTARWGDNTAHQIDRFTELDGYASLDAAFGKSPEDLVQLVKDAGLRGRGGAGFPTGMKWVDKDSLPCVYQRRRFSYPAGVKLPCVYIPKSFAP